MPYEYEINKKQNSIQIWMSTEKWTVDNIKKIFNELVTVNHKNIKQFLINFPREKEKNEIFKKAFPQTKDYKFVLNRSYILIGQESWTITKSKERKWEAWYVAEKPEYNGKWEE